MTLSETTQDFRGRFEIIRELGKGGMGEVYLAHDVFTQRDVAVKMAPLKMFDDAESGARLKKLWLNETRLAGKLRHPHIVEVYEAGTAEDFNYLVMEYVDGGTLREHTRPDSLLAVETVLEILYKVCNALEYALTQGLLHRDIKPANIMLTADGRVKVTDFGTAYFTQSDETQVFDVGTLPFMPPEHFSNRLPSVQSDIYAVGVMAYQLLCGAMPYQADSYEELINQKLNQDPIPLETRRKDLANEVRFVVHRAIHRNTEVRYQNWKAFCDDLAEALPQAELSREARYESARYEVLRQLPFFSGFSDAQIWEVIHLSEWQDIPEATVIFNESDPADCIYIIARGEISVIRENVVLNRVGAGECFGELAYLDEQRPQRSAGVQAATPLVLVSIDVNALGKASEGVQAAFNRAFMKLMVARLRRADQRFLDQFGGR